MSCEQNHHAKMSDVSPTPQDKMIKFLKIKEEDIYKELCCAVSTISSAFYLCESREVNDCPAAHLSSGMSITGTITELGVGSATQRDILSWCPPFDW